MTEAWFFGDHNALQQAGCPADKLPPKLKIGCDPEAFETDDAAFSLDDGAACSALIARNTRTHKADRPRWVLPSRPTIPWYRRESHPKAYLTWLCRDPEHERCSIYREAEGGAAALGGLRWKEVLGDPSHFVWARALIGDLADVLSVSLPDLTEGKRGSFLQDVNEQERVFRNL